jgi:hypothetical protein
VSVSSAVSTAQSAKKQRALDPPPFRAALCVRSKIMIYIEDNDFVNPLAVNGKFSEKMPVSVQNKRG